LKGLLRKRLRDREDNFVERKLESARADEYRATIVAFAVSVPEDRTGVLFVGIADNGDIPGVSNSEYLQRKIKKICDDCYPPIRPSIEVLDLEGKSVLAVEISADPDRPHFSGPAYARIGSQSVKASPEVFQRLIESRPSRVREILKWKDRLVTVVKSSGPAFECAVVDCRAHWVELRITSSSKSFS